MAQDPLADLRRDLAQDQAAPPTPEKPEPGASWLPDPYAHVVRNVTPVLDRAGVLGSPQGYLRRAGAQLIPQTSPELAIAAATAAIPGGIEARTGLKAADWLVGKGVMPFLSRAAATGGAGALAAAATGQSPTDAFTTGASGRVVGEPLGRLAQSAMQGSVSKLMMGRWTSGLADSFRETIGPWLSKGASDQRILAEVMRGDPSRLIGAEMNTIKAKIAAKPISVIDLQPVFNETGVTWTVPKAEVTGQGIPAPSKLTPGREMVPFGTVYDAIDAKEKALTKLVSDQASANAPVDATTLRHLLLLRNAQETVAARSQDPQMIRLSGEYGRVQNLRDWFWGARNMAATRGNNPTADLFDKQGNLTPEGGVLLIQGLVANAPKWAERTADRPFSGFRTDEIGAFANALNWDLAHGAARAEVGSGLSGLLPRFSVGPTGVPHAYWKGLPTASFVPGWEGQQNLVQRLSPAAIRAILAQQPTKFLPPRRDE